MKPMRKLVWMLCASLLLSAQALLAQTREITGKVTDSKDGSALSGATIYVQGTNRTTKSSPDGSFSVTAPTTAKTLLISFIGYKNQVINIGSGNVLVKMEQDVSVAEDVVVTGYKNRSKREFAGSAGTVKGDAIRATPIASFDQALQGQTPGLILRATSGQPGNSGSAIIRGRGSINGSTEPIYIVDGIQIAATDFALLNPNDIENVSVLKDAVAASMYGSRGGNGVIVVSTKRGRAGKPNLEIDAYTGWSVFPDFRDFKLMTANQKIDYELRRGGTSLSFYSAAEIDSMRKINTDWSKKLTRTGRTYSVNAAASGGSEKTRYYASMNYYKQDGTFINTGFDRLVGRINLSQDADNFTFGANITGTYSMYNNTSEINAGINAPLNALQWANPYEQEFVPGSYNAAGNFIAGGSSLARPRITETGQPIGTTEMAWNWNKDKQVRIVASGNAEYRFPFLKGLSAKVVYGIDYNQDEIQAFVDRRTYTAGTNPRPLSGANANFRTSSFARDYTTTQRVTNTNSLNFNRKFDDHSIDVGVYYEYIEQKNTNFGSTVFLLQTPLQNESGATVNADLLPRIRGGASEGRLQSYFALATYGYKNRYFVNANFRRDGSSRFGADKRYANFGGIGISWVALDEAFLQSWKNVFSDLKFKASYGTVGSQEGIGFYESQGIIGARLYNATAGLNQTSIANPDLQWENRKKFNVGIDYALFNGRLYGSLEYYRETTDNLFLPRELSRTTGFNTLSVNIGSVRNSGIEYSISGDVIRKRDLKLTLNANITYNKNEVVRLADKDSVISGFIIRAIGKPISSIYLVDYVGVNPANGESQYRKRDGTITETFSLADRKIQGTSDPKFFGGFGFNLNYKGLALSAQFSYMLGTRVYNNERANLENPDYYYDNVNSDLLKEWQKNGDITKIPSPNSIFQYETTRFLENNSFLRLRNVAISYTVPTKITSKLKMSGITAYVSGTNLWTLTGYRGRDPEFPGASVTGAQYPALRTVQAGLRLNF